MENVQRKIEDFMVKYRKGCKLIGFDCRIADNMIMIEYSDKNGDVWTENIIACLAGGVL